MKSAPAWQQEKKEISTVMSDDNHDAKHTVHKQKKKKKKTSEGSVPILHQIY